MFKKWKVMKPASLKEHQGGSHITFLARPQGEWIKTDKYYCGSRIYRCSLCCGEIDEMPTIMGVPMYNFCPNCGCRMRGDRR